ncbi:DMT family transporter [Microtetraspora niveoalba]|uniref:DMT family transporter n=1 Tax=Microtetraspora niveoalba TaxID=46175 RepID=UPI0008351995|nr:DMT family transporter [Microtetraspora niveoalba]
MIAVVCALLAAAANAAASVLQRRAAGDEAERGGLRLFWDLLHRPAWLAGVGALIAGFVLQAAALSNGQLALVQPLLVTELPFTMVLISVVSRSGLDRRAWLATGLLTVGLALFLTTAAPRGKGVAAGAAAQLAAGVTTVAVLVALVVAARFLVSAARAAALGAASGIGFAFTATFMKQTTTLFQRDASALPTSWQPYAMVATGLCAFVLLQAALRSGTLIAAQPALTISDPVASVLYGITIFGEEIRTGIWVVPEASGIGLMLYGSILLAGSLAKRDQNSQRGT